MVKFWFYKPYSVCNRFCFVAQRCIFIGTMSQKTITSFFKKLEGSKRKLEKENSELCQDSKRIKTLKLNTTEVVSVSLLDKELCLNDSSKFTIDFAVGTTWKKELHKEFDAQYFKELGDFLVKEKSRCTIYPPFCDVFSWTTSVEIYDVKVVILGQDPYIRPGQAHGLAFSVQKGVGIPKSLINIYAELAKDVPNFVRPTHGCLNGWANQGVLLLNSCLTVRAGQSDSHKGKGWEKFTDAVINWINENLSHVVFMLWGNNAKEKGKLISKDKHKILTAAHPSPLSASRGFFGCRHFSKANEYLEMHNKQGIDWKNLP